MTNYHATSSCCTAGDFDAMKSKWPQTVAEAVDRLLNKELTEENIEKIRRMKKDFLFELHFGLGMWIRNNFGFFQGNKELLVDCGKRQYGHLNMKIEGFPEAHPDDVSGIIIEALWERLQAEAKSLVEKGLRQDNPSRGETYE